MISALRHLLQWKNFQLFPIVFSRRRIIIELPFHDWRIYYSQKLFSASLSLQIVPLRFFSFLWMQASLEISLCLNSLCIGVPIGMYVFYKCFFFLATKIKFTNAGFPWQIYWFTCTPHWNVALETIEVTFKLFLCYREIPIIKARKNCYKLDTSIPCEWRNAPNNVAYVIRRLARSFAWFG